MSNDIQSIEDLISSSRGGSIDDESVEGKFRRKQKEIKIKEMERLTQSKADNLGVPYVNLFGFPISPDALSLVDEETAIRLSTVCFFYDGEKLRLATTDPENQEVKDLLNALKEKYFCEGAVYLISRHSLKYALGMYRVLPKVRKVVRGVEISADDLKRFEKEISDYRSLREKINSVNTSDVVTLILATAIKTRASDIHIEAEEAGILVRMRIDGVLQDAAKIDKEKWKKIISRMKYLAEVKINVSDKPQDGRYTIYLNDNKIEVRSSFLPTAFGESVVMRLLFSDAVQLSFNDLGISPGAFEVLKREVSKPNGMVLTTGPTGSGKTTTLYSILSRLNTEDTKVVTLEDPIEYQLEGINQSQVDESSGYTFANGLRSILRQDPDIVMVGEIRDQDTANIATQASLTGHLVLSTLHTNDASGVIPRLTEIGVKPYFLVPAINAIIGQRLVRRLCPECRIVHKLSEDEEERVRKILAVISPKAGVDIPRDLPAFYAAGEGCEKCQGLGYKGRIGIYEIFTMSEAVKQLTMDKQPAFKILHQAIEDGMVTMLQDGVLKSMTGITSLEEVYRVIGKFEYIDSLYDIVLSKTIGHGLKIQKEELERGKEASRNLNEINDKLNQTPSKEQLKVIMASAIESDAGDIHIEPSESGVKIRFRIDGILHEIASLPDAYYPPLLSAVKILAGFPTNVKKSTWDGRFNVGLVSEDKRIDCRVSIISGGYGETVVIRLLVNQASALNMDDLGMRGYSLKPLMSCMQKTRGIIVTTGPTGSGKTTTLYSILNKLNSPDIKIITVEDPIEYHMEGVMQTQVDSEGGYTFAAALKSLLRQNPNVIMIGEIRDEETARIAIESAMTGHLVLSTIHANSGAGAIPRFVGLGVDRQSLANSVECAIGQRLVRRICEHCRQPDDPDEQVLAEVKKILDGINPATGVKIPEKLEFYSGGGCEQCSGIGYKGRLGVYEVITMDPEMRKLIQKSGVTDHDIELQAVKNGAVMMLQDGVLKALNGDTSIDEVFRVAK